MNMKTTTFSASIGIIGGADGPTAVFVSGPPIWMVAAGVVVAAAIVTGIILYIKKR